MNKQQAKEQLQNFIGEGALTFTIKQYPNEEWVAQCNEIDSIITCGVGYDMAKMECLMQDAILTAAGIPEEYAEGLLKRVYNVDLVVPEQSEESDVIVTPLSSAYHLNNHYAGMGQV